MSEPESLLDSVRRKRQKYGTPLKNWEMGDLLNAVAWEHRDQGWVLAKKEQGAHTVQPRTGIAISRDILMHVPSKRMYDVLRDVAGEAEPNWLYVGDIDMEVVFPVGSEDEPQPDLRYWVERALGRVRTAKIECEEADEALTDALGKL